MVSLPFTWARFIVSNTGANAAHATPPNGTMSYLSLSDSLVTESLPLLKLDLLTGNKGLCGFLEEYRFDFRRLIPSAISS